MNILKVKEKFCELILGKKLLDISETLKDDSLNKIYDINTIGGLLWFKDYIKNYELLEFFPQSKSDKWDLHEKQLFMASILNAENNEIILAYNNKNGKYYSINSLQQILAIEEYLDGKFTLKDGLSIDKIKETDLHKDIFLKLHKFDTVSEGVRFYIDLKENN